jgi:hypothetical protein
MGSPLGRDCAVEGGVSAKGHCQKLETVRAVPTRSPTRWLVGAGLCQPAKGPARRLNRLMNGATPSGFNTDWNGPFLRPRSGLALAAIRLPHERTKSTAPQLLANVGGAQRPRPWLLCDSKPRLVGDRSLPCSAACLFNRRWRLLIQASESARSGLLSPPGQKRRPKPPL